LFTIIVLKFSHSILATTAVFSGQVNTKT